MTAWTRSRRPSLPSRRLTWILTVPSDRNKVSAISRLDRPWATRPNTSRSRPVSAARASVAAAGGGDVLEQEATGARAQAGVDVVVKVERGQDEDPGAGQFGGDLAGRGDPVGAWHADVHEDNLRAQGPRHGDGGGTVARFADDLDVRLGVEDHLEPGTDQRLVIDDQDADHVASLRGSRAETVQPCGERGPRDTSPPKAMTRSRIPSRPCPDGGSGRAAVPCPSSSARTRISDGAYWTRTVARASRPACFIVFVSASWMTRYTQSRSAELATEESPAVS